MPVSADDFDDAYALYLKGEAARAATLLQPLADAGHARAQSMLGHMYLTGRGVARDDAVALDWLTKAARQGDAAAQFNLGHMYAGGLGVAQDPAQAIRWFRRAAAQGDVDAQINLGFIYGNGWSVPVDRAEAYFWWSRAAARGSSQAAEARAALEREMSEAERARAETLALNRPDTGPSLAPIPARKPHRLAETPAASAAAAARRRQPAFQVQLGYFRDRAEARQATARLKAAHGDLLGPIGLEIDENRVGTSATFYRVVTEPVPERARASGLCARLRQRGIDCFTRQAR